MIQRWFVVVLVFWMGILFVPSKDPLEHHVALSAAVALLCTLALYAAVLVVARIRARAAPKRP